MNGEPQKSPWICHICDYKSSSSASRTCSLCYRVACTTHLQKVSRYDEESGLYQLIEVCVACAAH